MYSIENGSELYFLLVGEFMSFSISPISITKKSNLLYIVHFENGSEIIISEENTEYFNDVYIQFKVISRESKIKDIGIK